MSRYVPPTEEFEPGSDGQVLRNLLGVTDPATIGRLESEALILAYEWSLSRFTHGTVFDTSLIQGMHRQWLGGIYPFAGEWRTVNVSKGGVLFAPVEHLHEALRELDAVLAECTTTFGQSQAAVARNIAQAHVELVLVHPFREGNGRLARWLADLMAIQAGSPTLDWGFSEATPAVREAYFAALRDGFAGRLDAITQLVSDALARAKR